MRGGISASLFGLLVAAAASMSPRSPDVIPGAPGAPPLRLTKAVGSPVVMAWRARVNVAGAEFRVYRGPDVRHLERVVGVRADRGEGGYRIRDTGSSSQDAFYEVRLVDREGREHLVASAFCARSAGLDVHAATQSARPLSPFFASAAASMQGPSQPLDAPAVVGVVSQSRSRPLAPPPRADRRA